MAALVSWKNMKLRSKLMLAFLVVGLVPFAVSAVIMITQSAAALEKSKFDEITAIRQLKLNQINGFMKETKSDLAVLNETATTLTQEAYVNLRAIQTLQRNDLERYFTDRINLLNDVKQNLRFTAGLPLFAKAFREGLRSENYRKLSRDRESGFRVFMDNFHFYDVFLIDSDGNVVYTVTKESDLGANLMRGNLKNSGLGRAFARTVAGEAVVLEDFAYYEPSKDHSMFIATPLHDSDGQYIGAAAFQLAREGINESVQQRSGLKSTFESYLVGSDGSGKTSLRSDRVVKTEKIGEEKSSSGITAAQQGKSGEAYKVGSTGVYELEVYQPINIPGLKWSIHTTGALEEILKVQHEGEEKDYFQKYQEIYGTYDIFLISPDGYVFYSVTHEADYQTNLVDGKWKDTHLGQLFRDVMRSKEFGLTDIKKYAPSNDAPAIFAAQPVIVDNKVALVLAVQLSTGDIDEVMQERTGLGNSGETYLVGWDKLMRSESRFKANTILEQKVDTKAVEVGITNTAGTEIIDDYRGTPVLSSWSHVGLDEEMNTDFDWVIIAEIDESEALAVVRQQQIIAATLAVVVIIAVIIIAYLVAGQIANPIIHMANIVTRIANERDLTLSVPVESGDEIGTMSGSLNNMLRVIHDAFGVVSQAAIAVDASAGDVAKRASGNRNRAQQQYARAQEASQVIGEMGQTAGKVRKATGDQAEAAQASQARIAELLKKMQQVSATAVSSDAEVQSTLARVGEMGETGAKVVASAQSQEQMVQRVTESIQEMVSSVSQMQSAVNQATEYGRSSLQAAEEGARSVAATVDGMRSISESSEQISEIIDVITEIAEQTNLLALNAAVEAARAGAHGKGFAVVADEVGKLAQRSSEAAKEITQLIKDSSAGVAEGVRLSDMSQQALQRIDEGGRVNMQAIEGIAKSAQTLNDATGQVQNLIQELNVLAGEIGGMAGEQGQRRVAAQQALDKVVEFSKEITGLVNEANASVQEINKQMEGVVQRSTDMNVLTGEQATRSQKVTAISAETAEAASQTVEGAGVVVSVTEDLQKQSANLTEQVQQFKI
ncbi:MAG: methyl-accepting chemotaxis protein [Chromatiales bacterium]|nr:methyl-accepting chemotaxis protein [Chromatiales bacterium]